MARMELEYLQPNLDHRERDDFARTLGAVVASDGELNRPEDCPIEAVASVGLVADALDAFDDPKSDIAPLTTALQELGAWQVMLPRRTHAQWWRAAARLDDEYAASMAAAAAIYQTVPSVTTKQVHARLNAVPKATPFVEPLEGALLALQMRERDYIKLAKYAAVGSARRLVEMYSQAVDQYCGDELLLPAPPQETTGSRARRRGKKRH